MPVIRRWSSMILSGTLEKEFDFHQKPDCFGLYFIMPIIFIP
jgi:hypothetical protein